MNKKPIASNRFPDPIKQYPSGSSAKLLDTRFNHQLQAFFDMFILAILHRGSVKAVGGATG